MEQVVVQIGNSAGVVIPKELRRQVGLRLGSKVRVEKQGNRVLITPASLNLRGGVDAKFMQMVDEFASEHADVLAELAVR